MAVAPLRTMLSAAREEGVALTAELANTARASTFQIAEAGYNAASGAGRIAAEMNPVGVRHAIQMSVKEGGESSILQNLSHPKVPVPTSITTSTTSSITTTAIHDATSLTTIQETINTISTTSTSAASESTLVTQALNRDLAITFREAVGNATQTGMEEQLEEMAEYAKALSKHAGSSERAPGGIQVT